MDLLCKELTETHRVMILGGGKLKDLAKELPNESINVRFVDYNRLKAGQISHVMNQ